MNTPIHDFVNKYSHSDGVRAHMPGHKGDGEQEKFDITEISGADSLYEAEGIIKESEKHAGEIFGAYTFYSTEGSSLSIKAMLYLTVLYSREIGREPLILAARNVHKSFVNGIALLDTKVEWLYSNSVSYLECKITPEALDNYLKTAKQMPTALYLTSPDYLGNIQDIKGLSEVCKKYGLLLLCDNAHGAYLKFLKPSAHPIDLGADIVCDSAHKTLPVLTGGAYLHISKNAPVVFKERAKDALALFGSTSPSYLILSSLDRFNGSIPDFIGFAKRCNQLKQQITALGYTLTGDEPLKITIQAKKYGYEGTELQRELEAQGIICEFADPDFLVLMLSPKNTDIELEKILKGLKKIPKKASISALPPSTFKSEAKTSPREALLSLSEELPTDGCEGRIFASSALGCPPAVPILVSGEVITKEAIEAFKYYRIDSIRVVKD